ncbi:hypothetical protein BS50DRAFT_580498 [Corynespora cassiicola Philippines]|uniref:Uncharacterized protein n=1 Tax=Corynespora cassiicola Philippines TaxID=1448308 RepID=A0A2T2MZU2_CORCC|nr:hypothetical protein BS50DRAFT_580498 [Corynespora cassiicola Philippines]
MDFPAAYQNAAQNGFNPFGQRCALTQKIVLILILIFLSYSLMYRTANMMVYETEEK